MTTASSDTRAAPIDAATPVDTPVGVVVGHTHWDREWYLPFESFRARLVAMMDGLLEYLERDPAFRCFVLDGQSIMVEDYLDVRPEAEPRVRRLAQDGRLKIGPWYTAVDTFLPDPESLIRNLQIGRWSARRWGGQEMRIGHLADTFGFIGQLPQILRHFGLEDAFAWRGLHPVGGTAACWWESPDGSRVLVMRPAEGYCEGALGVVDPARFLEEALPGILRYQDDEPYKDRLFVIGCDHYPASARLPWLADQIAHRVGHPVHVGPLEEMAARLRPVGDRLPVIHDEQRDPCLAVCPASVSGTRISQIKQVNQRVEALLLGVAEPLQALAELNGGGADRAHLRWAWRLLAQNHPHDSIPGCSTDVVHREMSVRFERARAAAVDVAQRGAKRLAATLHPAARGDLGAIGVVGLDGGHSRLRLRLHAQPDQVVPAFRITTPDGRAVPFVQLARGVERVTYRKLEDAFVTEGVASYVHLLATREWVDSARTAPAAWDLPFVDLDVEVEAPRAGYSELRIERAAERALRSKTPRWQPAAPAELANEHARVWVGRDGLYIEDRAMARVAGPIYFSHAGDSGDEYTANPVLEPPVLFWPDGRQVQVTEDAIGRRMRVPIRVHVPARLAPGRKARVGRVTLAGELRVTLVGPRADLDLVLDNHSRDFDLRLIAHVGDAIRAWSGAPFGIEERGTELNHSSPTAPQQWLPDFPFRGWLAAHAADGAGLAVFARGLYEAAVRRTERGGVDLALTLLRGVGWLSRADLLTRPGHAGPAIATPDAQCLGKQRWELALRPFGPSEWDALPLLAEQFLRPPALFPIQWSAGSAPARRWLFEDADDRLVVSALRPADTLSGGAMLHAHNPTRSPRQATVPGERARVDETRTEGNGPLRPFEIAAWRVNSTLS
jgi:mannosylglycerate hydrolase